MIARIRTVQGMGDIFWTYQKLAPYFEAITYDILTIDNDCPVQTRSEELLKLLPRCSNYGFVEVPDAEYHRVAALKSYLPVHTESLPKDEDVHYIECEYAVNRWLEEGRNLYDIELGARVLEHVDLLGVPKESPALWGGLCVYVAGQKREGLWSSAQWAQACLTIIDTLGLRPSVNIIGAIWDAQVADALQEHLQASGKVHVHNGVGRFSLIGSISRIREAELFFAFQSGLSVIAENYDQPQIMVYYDDLTQMMGTWKGPKSKHLQEMTFGQYDRLKEILNATRIRGPAPRNEKPSST